MSKTPLHIELPPYPPPQKAVLRKDSSQKQKSAVPPQGEMSRETAVLIHQAVCDLLDTNRYEDAFLLSEVTCRGRPDYADAYFNASLALYHLGRFSESKSFMQRGPESLWQNAEAHYHMSSIAALQKDWASVLAHAQEAAKINPKHTDALYNSSLALFHLRRYSDAKAVIQSGPKSLWEKAAIHYQMACVEVALGNLEFAVTFAEKAAAIDPTLLDKMLDDTDLKPIWTKIGRPKDRAEAK